MTATASPARATADSAAVMNDRLPGNCRSSDVCDNNTRRGGGRFADMTHNIPALTQVVDHGADGPTGPRQGP